MKGFSLPKLNRDHGKRTALIRQLVTHLFEHEQIKTTFTRAKAVQRYAERCISMAKRGSLTGKLKIFQFVNKPEIGQKVINEISPRYTERPGGYTRVLKYATRPYDQAPMAIIELVDNPRDIRKQMSLLNTKETIGKGLVSSLSTTIK